MDENEVIEEAVSLNLLKKRPINSSSDKLTPNWHFNELEDREKKVKNDKTSFLDIENVKENLGSLIK